MTRYFFQLQGSDADPSDIGVDLPSDAAAQQEALRTIAEMLKDRCGGAGGTLRLLVTNEDGLMLFVVDVSVVAAPAVAKRLRTQ